MTIEDVRNSVEEIRDLADVKKDDELAHVQEDILYQDVLKNIASGELSLENAILFAQEALKTNKIDFSRWYA